MVIAYHLVWTAYGWWLPNDPRGSMSHCIRSDVLQELGELHYGKKRVQCASEEIREFYEHAAAKLRYAPALFTGDEVELVGRAFAEVTGAQRYTCYACAIMPDHVHILVRKHRDQAEEMIGHLQRESHLILRGAGLRDLEHPVWGGKGWKVFLDSAGDIRRTVKYIEQNPIKMGLTRQRWGFVTRYDGWDGGMSRGRAMWKR